MEIENPDYARRFGGVARLYGAAGLAKLQAAHIVVVGIGGVGSWAAEALARNAVGTITLIDLDVISESNFNRQIHAQDGNIGKDKIAAMRERILSINPSCQVRMIEDFVTLQNASKMLDFHYDCLLDCVDDARAKTILASVCSAVKTPIIMSGSAGGRLDPTRIKVADLSAVTNDKLLAKVRNSLRRDYAFPVASNSKKSAKFGITCVYSDEPVLTPNDAENASCELDLNANIGNDALGASIHAASSPIKNARAITGLNCAGYGSSVCVTAPMGFAVAGLALQSLLKPSH
jgi:tRNA threonylcarbamoyladenosine dehydratase